MSNPKGNPSSLKSYKPKWNQGQTKTIRVPASLAEEILEYAHRLDSSESLDTSNSSIATEKSATILKDKESLTQAIEVLELVCKTPNTAKFSNKLKSQIKGVIKELQSLTQVIDTLKQLVKD